MTETERLRERNKSLLRQLNMALANNADMYFYYHHRPSNPGRDE